MIEISIECLDCGPEHLFRISADNPHQAICPGCGVTLPLDDEVLTSV